MEHFTATFGIIFVIIVVQTRTLLLLSLSWVVLLLHIIDYTCGTEDMRAEIMYWGRKEKKLTGRNRSARTLKHRITTNNAQVVHRTGRLSIHHHSNKRFGTTVLGQTVALIHRYSPEYTQMQMHRLARGS
jgi:hypothetical protein